MPRKSTPLSDPLRPETRARLNRAVDAARAVVDWNETWPVGTAVLYWSGARQGLGRLGQTRSTAWMCSVSPVVSCTGYAGGIALTHVEPLLTLNADRWQTWPLLDLLRRLQLNVRTVDSWIDAGLIDPAPESTRGGRVLDLVGLFHLVATTELRRQKIPVRAIAELFRLRDQDETLGHVPLLLTSLVRSGLRDPNQPNGWTWIPSATWEEHQAAWPPEHEGLFRHLPIGEQCNLLLAQLGETRA